MEQATITIITSEERRGEHAIQTKLASHSRTSFKKTKLISSRVTFSLHRRCARKAVPGIFPPLGGIRFIVGTRRGAVLGSSSARRIAQKVDLADPCSPESAIRWAPEPPAQRERFRSHGRRHRPHEQSPQGAAGTRKRAGRTRHFSAHDDSFWNRYGTLRDRGSRSRQK
jgi:hypothetical protein